MKLEAAFKDILNILENLKISLNVHAKSLKNVCEEVYFSKVADFLWATLLKVTSFTWF